MSDGKSEPGLDAHKWQPTASLLDEFHGLQSKGVARAVVPASPPSPDCDLLPCSQKRDFFLFWSFFLMCYIHTCMLHMWASATLHDPVQTLLGIKSTVTINKITISYWGIPIIAVFSWLGRSSFIYRPEGEWTFFSAFRFVLLCTCILHSLTMCVERAEAVSVSFGLFSA